ncbi:MAG: type II secretion system minor pseudopilin GspI [Gammaproteobacteria bacterium]|nr:type II secretion system minor pseudopilin GspI [Gammaproteobacteria bacterium]MBL7000416.1 type II secretion system minor pseudopilin GspI [Gammaproteobacteria bacterium]MBL7000598.1 type II secretion system minor pseudopilin GspI [Gammaproteobacteria bacterium]
MKARFQNAFTLIEIMVALAIIGLTMGAIIENTTASTRNALYLQEKTIASWIAMNQISLVRARREWTSVSNKKGEVEMANREWIWKMEILKTDDPNMRRLNVDVYLADKDDQSLASMTGFLGQL